MNTHPFFFNDTATTEIYTLSLHDALPISSPPASPAARPGPSPSAAGRPAFVATMARVTTGWLDLAAGARDRKSTRLNSSHANISYAVFCLKKKKNHNYDILLVIDDAVYFV